MNYRLGLKHFLEGKDPILSQIGLIIKVKDGREKKRIILDVKRAGVTRVTRRSYRVVLPRTQDAVNDALALLAACVSEEDAEALVEALERLETLELPPQKPFIIRSRFANGTRMYAYYFVEKTKHFFIRPDWTRGLIPLSHDAPITTDYWDDDGTTEFRQMLERVEQERGVIEAP